VDRIAEAGWLAILARDVSKVLMDLGMCPALVFCFVFTLFLDVKYYKDSASFMFLHHWACCRHP
jgi:hypothetical protein